MERPVSHLVADWLYWIFSIVYVLGGTLPLHCDEYLYWILICFLGPLYFYKEHHYVACLLNDLFSIMYSIYYCFWSRNLFQSNKWGSKLAFKRITKFTCIQKQLALYREIDDWTLSYGISLEIMHCQIWGVPYNIRHILWTCDNYMVFREYMKKCHFPDLYPFVKFLLLLLLTLNSAGIKDEEQHLSC